MRNGRLEGTACRAAPGDVVTLSEGKTYFELAGREIHARSAVPVVLIHGFSVPSFIWESTFIGLVKAGFRVLRYDLYGRGYSDRPSGRYDLARFDRQAIDLITALDLPTPVDVVGLSMGGAVAVSLTDRHPELVRGLALIDPAGFPMSMPWPVRLLHVPLVGELLMLTVGRRLLVARLTQGFSTPEKLPKLAEKYRVQMRHRGLLRALLSTIRHGPLQNMADAYERVGRQERDILLIWGCEDRMVPFELSERVRAALPNAKFCPIPEAGHAPHLERPDLVNPLLVDYLSSV